MFLSLCSPQSTKVTSILPCDVLLHTARDADATRLGERLQPGRHVDAVPENVWLLDDDVADIDADSEFDALFGRHRDIALSHAALDFDGAAHGFDDAGKLGQQPVAGCLDDASAMLVDRRVDEDAQMLIQPRQRAFLVGAHKAAVTGDISREDRRQSPIHTLRRQVSLPIGSHGLFCRIIEKNAFARHSETCAGTPTRRYPGSESSGQDNLGSEGRRPRTPSGLMPACGGNSEWEGHERPRGTGRGEVSARLFMRLAEMWTGMVSPTLSTPRHRRRIGRGPIHLGRRGTSSAAFA